MRIPKTISYCAPLDVIKLIEKDGSGWGHDLQCGRFFGPATPSKTEAK